MKKNILIYIGIILLGLILRIVSLFVTPIAIANRKQIFIFANKRFFETPARIFVMRRNYVRWHLYLHPYFWLFCFTTGLTNNYYGPDWYKKELKAKWFTDIDIEILMNGKSKTVIFLDKLRYFWLCYLWMGIRNAHWAFSEWFFREGVYIEGTMKIVKEKGPTKLPELIMPEAKFKDLDGTYRDNSGPYIRYPYEAAEQWQSTNEGKKLMIFKTHKGKERFYFGYCKIIPVRWLMKFLVIEILFGWNWWNGIPVLHNKYMFKEMDFHSVRDYQKYQRTISIE